MALKTAIFVLVLFLLQNSANSFTNKESALFGQKRQIFDLEALEEHQDSDKRDIFGTFQVFFQFSSSFSRSNGSMSFKVKV